jgi:hypothetical protein
VAAWGDGPTRGAGKFSVGAWEDEFEQLWLYGHEARAPVEAPSLPVALLDDDLERSRPFRDRIALCVGEQPVSDATPLVAGRDEQLLDHDRPAFLAAQGDVAGRLTLLAGDEDQIALQHLEYPLVAPAGQTGERALREPEQLRQVSLHRRSDVELGCQRGTSFGSDAGTQGRQLELQRILQPPDPRLQRPSPGH